MLDVLEKPLYEVSFYSLTDLIRIDRITVDSGVLYFEHRGKNRRTHVQRLVTGCPELFIHPGCFGTFRGFPNDPMGLANGSFRCHHSRGHKDYSYPWKDPSPPECKTYRVLYPDVLIVGSGPLGATYARKIIQSKKKASVLMVEMGAQESVVIGEHKKNQVRFQRDIDSFGYGVKGDMGILSIPVNQESLAKAEANGIYARQGFVQRGQNPDQNPRVNLSTTAATRCVGGMSTHWTCCTPREVAGIDRSDIFAPAEWELLYTEAEGFLGTSTTQFDVSIRHQLVMRTLQAFLPDRDVGSLPLACNRNQLPEDPHLVTWAASNTILGNTVNELTLLPNHQCMSLLFDPEDEEIGLAVIKNLRLADGSIYVCARKYVVCAGAILTPQILFNSGFRDEEGSLPALGHWMTEQQVAFCQVMLHEQLIAQFDGPPYPDWLTPQQIADLEEHGLEHPEDPVPFPFFDPDPQVTIPISIDFPWHTQIHQDAFHYVHLAPDMDTRLVVALRFFSRGVLNEENNVLFSEILTDQFNMPQPTFNYVLGDGGDEEPSRMMVDMVNVAQQLGSYIPGSEPKFLEPGLAIHVCGTTRAGNNPDESVVNQNSQVWGVGNLWLGTTGVIPNANATNPTLTAMCFAIWGADNLIAQL